MIIFLFLYKTSEAPIRYYLMLYQAQYIKSIFDSGESIFEGGESIFEGGKRNVDFIDVFDE